MENLARAQRIAEAMTTTVASKSIRGLVGIRQNIVTAVFSKVRRVSGWTAPQIELADDLRAALLLLGPAVLVGLSSDQPSTSFIPRALHEAMVALDFASVTDRVVEFSRLPIRRLLLHRGADYVQSALPRWSAVFHDADAKMRGALVTTLRAYADADMNVLKAARALTLHPNTVYARLQRINDLTGLDCQRFHDLTELLLAADCRRT
jgi:sugar diacid utilization regulator